MDLLLIMGLKLKAKQKDLLKFRLFIARLISLLQGLQTLISSPASFLLLGSLFLFGGLWLLLPGWYHTGGTSPC